MEWAQYAAIRLSIDVPEMVWHDVKHTRIILKVVKFEAHVNNRVNSL